MTILACVSQDTTTLSPEEAKRQAILVVINALTGTCKSVVQSHYASSHDSLPDGCKELESFKSLLGLVGCHQTDYDKLHAEICYLNGVYVG